MIDYLLLNTLLSALILIFIKYVQSNHHTQYWLSALAVIIWCVPLPLLANLVALNTFIEPISLSISQVTKNTTQWVTTHNDLAADEWLNYFVWGCFSFGLTRFILRIYHALSWQKKRLAGSVYLENSLSQHTIKVYLATQKEPGFLLGLIKPVIVLSNQLSHANIKLVIAHEKQHAKTHDNYRLLLLELCESLFWWNPLVKRAVAINRFSIEALCDERTAKTYGKQQYLHQLTQLMLNSDAHYKQSIACSALSLPDNNLKRIKLLKEEPTMSYTKWIAYFAIIITTISTLTWHTFAQASHNNITQDPEQLGALVNLTVNVKKRNVAKEFERETDSEFQIWVNFDKQASFKINDDFLVHYRIKDNNGIAAMEFEMIETAITGNKTVAKPALQVHYEQAAVIEIDNPAISNHAYRISATAQKTKQPQ